mmetsp:Transcript_5327/g.14798  ORF Transcript_5327/g.14798 Transcript_5327/m.14798 type:complete len:207 (+) Transcript_5327:115-735(+)
MGLLSPSQGGVHGRPCTHVLHDVSRASASCSSTRLRRTAPHNSASYATSARVPLAMVPQAVQQRYSSSSSHRGGGCNCGTWLQAFSPLELFVEDWLAQTVSVRPMAPAPGRRDQGGEHNGGQESGCECGHEDRSGHLAAPAAHTLPAIELSDKGQERRRLVGRWLHRGSSRRRWQPWWQPRSCRQGGGDWPQSGGGAEEGDLITGV